MIKLMMKMEVKKNLVAICYDVMLLLIIHVTPDNPFTPRQTDGNLQCITHSDVGSEGTKGGANDGNVAQVQTFVMKFNQCRMTLRNLSPQPRVGKLRPKNSLT